MISRIDGENTVVSGVTSARTFRLLFILFVVLHSWKVFRLLPIQLLSDGKPLVEYHYSQIYSDVVQDRAFRQANGHSWGYDPYSGGGQISGAGLVPESHAVLLLDRCLRPFVRPDTTVKIFVTLALLAGPILLFGAARLFRYSPEVSLLAAALSSAGMISHDEISRLLVYRGHVTFWLSCFVAIFNAASLYAWTLRPRRWLAMMFTLTWPLLLLLDPSMSLIQFVPTIAITAFDRHRRASAADWMTAAIVLAVAVNAFWLVPYVKFHATLLPMSEFPSAGLRALTELLLPVSGDIFTRINAVIRGYLFLMGISGILALRRDRRVLALALAGWCFALALVGLAGSSLPAFRAMEPGRLVFAATTVLLIPAASFAAPVFIIPGSRRILFAGWLLWIMMTWQLVHPTESYPLRSDLTPREQRLLADFRDLPPNGRILVQYNPLFTDGLRIAALQRVHAFAGFPGSWWKSRGSSDGQFMNWEGRWYFFGRDLSSCTPEFIRETLRAYNIAYVVTTAPKGIATFSDLMGLEEIPSRGAGAYHIYRGPSAARGSYVVSGSGNLTFGYSTMHLRGATSGVIVTAFRYAEGFQTNPPLIVRGQRLSADGPELLAFENKAGRTDIEVRYAPR